MIGTIVHGLNVVFLVLSSVEGLLKQTASTRMKRIGRTRSSPPGFSSPEMGLRPGSMLEGGREGLAEKNG